MLRRACTGSLTAVLLTAVAPLGLVCCANNGQLSNDFKRLERDFSDVRSFQAEQTTRISALEGELRALSGRIEELEYAQDRRLGSDLSALKQDVSDLRRRVPPPPIVPLDALEIDEAWASRLPVEISETFKDALAKIREGRFQEAETLLRDAHDLAQGTSWAPNILFWMAVANEGRGDNRAAVSAYHEIVVAAPRHDRVPLALLREASVLIRLGDTKTARLTLNKLITQYPKSKEALRAKEKLQDL